MTAILVLVLIMGLVIRGITTDLWKKRLDEKLDRLLVLHGEETGDG